MGLKRAGACAPRSYKLADSCTLVVQEGDITKWSVDGKSDAVVNAAHEWLLGGGGVDGAIHRVAGKGLLDHCTKLPNCPPGEAVSTPAFRLPVKRIIHTVGPRYRKTQSRAEAQQSAETLKNAYRNSLKVARDEGIKYIAFAALSCGISGYPLGEAAQIAVDTVMEEAEGFAEIHFVLFTRPVCEAWAAAVEKAGLEPCIHRSNNRSRSVKAAAW